jgi:hypothetical protein
VISILRTYRHDELESFIPEALRKHSQVEHGSFKAGPGITPYYFSMARKPATRPRGRAVSG